MRVSSNSFTEDIYKLYQKNQSSPQETTFNDLLKAAASDVQNAQEPRLQIWVDYQNWKSQQLPRQLPDSQGATDENIAYLLENFTGKLSLFQRIEAVDTMREMGIITEDQMMRTLGFGVYSLYKVPAGNIICTGAAGDRDLETWSSFFGGNPLMEACNLDDLFDLLDKQLRFTRDGGIVEKIQEVLDRVRQEVCV